MRSRPPALVLVAAALASAGCGGSDADEPVRGYFQAIAARDGAKACDQLTPGLRRSIEASPVARGSGRSCAEVMGLAAALNPKVTEDDVSELDVDVDEDGDRAVARVVNPFVRRRETLRLSRAGGEWRIATLQTRPQP